MPPILKSCPIVPLFVRAKVITAFFFTVFGATTNLNSDAATVTRCGVADPALPAPRVATTTATAATRTILLTMPPDLVVSSFAYDDALRPDGCPSREGHRPERR